MYLGLQLQMGKLLSLIKLLHKAVFWDWHTQISEHELSKSLPLFLFLNVFSSRRLKLQLETPPSFGSRAFYKWHSHSRMINSPTALQRGKIVLGDTSGTTS